MFCSVNLLTTLRGVYSLKCETKTESSVQSMTLENNFCNLGFPCRDNEEDLRQNWHFTIRILFYKNGSHIQVKLF